MLRKIDEFCARHPNFGLRRLMIYIVSGCVAVYFFCSLDTTNTFYYNLSFNLGLIMRGQIWRLFTYIFLPYSNSPIAFVITLYFYYIVGSVLEQIWGTAKFNLYYLFGVTLSTLYGVLLSLVLRLEYIALSSVYLNLSLFFAYATFYPDNMVLLFFFIPVKVKYIAVVNALFFLYNVFALTFPINLFPLMAILNFLIFCGPDLFYYIKRGVAASRIKNSSQSIHFREEARRAKKDVNDKPYRHKCAVCGRTDTDYPNLQFRYCSKCEGYHCFCEDHINNHIHFTK